MVEDQRGKLMRFVLIGVVLLSILTGGLYAAKLYNQNKQVTKEPVTPSETAEQPTKPQEVAKEPEAKKEQSDTTKPPTQQQSQSQNQSAPTAQVGAATIPASGTQSDLFIFLILGGGVYALVWLIRSQKVIRP